MSFENYEIACASRGVPGSRGYFKKVSIFAFVMSEDDSMTKWPRLVGITRTED